MERICLTIRLLILIAFVSITLSSCCQDSDNELVYRNSNYLDTIPDSIFSNTNIHILRIFGNDCDFVDDSCANITEIPIGILRLKNLEELYFIMNDIKEVPYFLSDLKRLRILDLSNNRGLIKFEGLNNMNKLEILNLNDCNLSTLPKIIFELHNLKVLGLEGNYFSQKEQKSIRVKLPNTKFYF